MIYAGVRAYANEAVAGLLRAGFSGAETARRPAGDINTLRRYLKLHPELKREAFNARG